MQDCATLYWRLEKRGLHGLEQEFKNVSEEDEPERQLEELKDMERKYLTLRPKIEADVSLSHYSAESHADESYSQRSWITKLVKYVAYFSYKIHAKYILFRLKPCAVEILCFAKE